MRRLVLCVIVLAAPAVTLAADWSRFRGPNGSGEVVDPAVPVQWTKTQNVLWSVPVPGKGNSSPVVVKGRVFVQSASDDGKTRSVYCIDATTGATKWSKTYPASAARVHAKSSLASCTPGSDGERVFFILWDGDRLTARAYDLDGTELWQHVLGGYVSQHGAGMSPVPFDGKVFINYDQDKTKDKSNVATPNPARLVALDAATGSQAWVADRKAFRACYSSPLVRPLPGGKSEVVVATTAGITGYDPASGAVNWDFEWKFDGQALRNVGSPLLIGDVVVAISGDGSGSRHMIAISAGPNPKLLWEKKKDTPYVPCPLTRGGYLYWLTDSPTGSLATCCEVRTGKIVWSERVFNKPVSSSPVLVGDTVVAVAEDGKAVAFKADPAGFEKVADSTLGEAVFASPAVADGRLYVRGAQHLFCIAAK